MTAYVYIEHLQRSYVGLPHAGRRVITVRHYLGWAQDVATRHAQHQNGTGARLLQVVARAGITFHISRVWKCKGWKEARKLERRLKRQKNTPRLCPICNPTAYNLSKELQDVHKSRANNVG